jgi:hypothetical protein
MIEFKDTPLIEDDKAQALTAISDLTTAREQSLLCINCS